MKRKINSNIDVNKAATIIYIVNIAQILILFSFITYSLIHRDGTQKLINRNLEMFFGILCIVIFANSYIALRDVKAIKSLNAQHSIQDEVIKQIKDLNNTLKSQRHDFLNHLQVVYSLIEMNEYKEASSYIEKVYEDIRKVNRVLKTSDTAINALLQAKQLDCEDRGILVEINIETRLDKLKVPSWEMCRVLGNLVDNAIDATEGNENKYLLIDISEEHRTYKFIVKNNGEMIPIAVIDKIFEAGFSTKGDSGQGMGLAISKSIVEKYGGSIAVETNETNTTFQVIVPFE